ncbi:MAG: hypothetical protein M9963_12090 [Kiritimatiellae bacterium]|nr:hypothetical protein [Kiritimatiellia bacterium]MCO5062711.1 hypothetical protein [Kiritimatiellia bacterium]MCO6401059.1 hypothetical protein [Verrucomicrobiota bacterium]
MKFIPALCLSTALLGASIATAQERGAAPKPTPAAATAPAEAPSLATIMKKLDDLEARIAALDRKLQSVSRFLGDSQSYGTANVDDRLRDLQRALDDVQRSVDRLR